MVLALVAMPACKDKDGATGKGGGGATAVAKAEPASAGNQSARLAEIKAIDCDATCKSQIGCYRKAGLATADKPETMKMCMDGCAMLVSDAGSVDIKLTVGAKMLEYAAGRCP